MSAVRKVCSAMLSGLSTPAISQPVRLERLSRPISYRKLVRPSSSGFGIGLSDDRSWAGLQQPHAIVNLLQLPARLRRQVTLAGQRLGPDQEPGGELGISLEDGAAALQQSPGRMHIQVGQRFSD